MSRAKQTGRGDVDAGAVGIDRRIASFRSMNRTTCPTCAKADVAPYRRIIHDVIVEGCIDAFHGPALVATEPRYSASLAWHFRPVAVAFRVSILARLHNGRFE